MNDEALAGGRALARSADVLTAGRMLLALPMGLAAYSAGWRATALLLSLSWWSDFLDGRLARRAGGSTRLGAWDLAADTLVGAGLLVGVQHALLEDHVRRAELR